MRARIGDLAIARFDPEPADIQAGRKWDEQLCIVVEMYKSGLKKKRSCQFMFWEKTKGGRTTMGHYELPVHRVVRARPVNNKWNGELSSLTLDTVVCDVG